MKVGGDMVRPLPLIDEESVNEGRGMRDLRHSQSLASMKGRQTQECSHANVGGLTIVPPPTLSSAWCRCSSRSRRRERGHRIKRV